MQKTSYDIIVFLIFVSALIVVMVAFIVSMVFLYRKRQHKFERDLEQNRLAHEKNLLSTKLEVQEQTFQYLAREIHDNINLSLTLAKLNLNTLSWGNRENAEFKLNCSIELLTKSIAELSDISRGLNSEVITQHGLLKALEDELHRIRQAAPFAIFESITGEPVFMNNQQELIIFRIIQEAFNNIIKHARAGRVDLSIHYGPKVLGVVIADNGSGFDVTMPGLKTRSGLMNMAARCQMLGGHMKLNSKPGNGTTLTFTVPYHEDDE